MSTPARLLIVRHGQSQANAESRIGGHTDSPLTELGQKQAQAAADRIAELSPDRIISSDIVRAHQTAEPIAQACDLQPTLDKRFRERTLGKFDGMLMKDFKDNHAHLYEQLMSRRWDFCVPTGEPSKAMYARVSEGLDEVAALGGTSVIISHGIAIFFMFLHACGIGIPDQSTKVFSLVSNCSLTVLTKESRWWRIDRLNDCAHLE